MVQAVLVEDCLRAWTLRTRLTECLLSNAVEEMLLPSWYVHVIVRVGSVRKRIRYFHFDRNPLLLVVWDTESVLFAHVLIQ